MLAPVFKLVLATLNVDQEFKSVAMSKNGEHVTVLTDFEPGYRSSDYGRTWKPVPPTRFTPAVTHGFRFIGMTEDAAYQLICNFGGNAVYESNDGGDNWAKVYFTDTIECQGVAVSKDGTRRTLLSRKDNSNYHIWTWVSDVWTKQTFDATFVADHTAGLYRGFDVGRIDMSETGEYQSFLFRGHDLSGVNMYRSEDFGASWTRGATTVGGITVNKLHYRDIAVSSNGQTQVMIAENGPYLGFDDLAGGYGIMKSTDAGISFAYVTETGLNNDLLLQYDALSMSGDADHISALFQRSHTDATGNSAYVRDKTNNDWSRKAFPETDPGNIELDIAVSYEETAGETIQIIAFDKSIYRSEDSGETWTKVFPEPPPPPPGPGGGGGGGGGGGYGSSDGGGGNGAVIGGAVGGSVLIVICGVSYYVKCGPFAKQSFVNENLL